MLNKTTPGIQGSSGLTFVLDAVKRQNSSSVLMLSENVKLSSDFLKV